jgi:hypothetical protein
MDFVERVTRTQFLGAEFLTWLWYQEEVGGGQFQLGGDLGDIELSFEDKLTMGSTALDEQQDSFKGGRPTASPEARAALKLGKQAQSASLRLTQGEQEWRFTLKAEPLMMSAVRLPEVLADDPKAQFHERMLLLETLDRLYRALFKLFLEERLSAEWATEHLPAIQSWAARREQQA